MPKNKVNKMFQKEAKELLRDVKRFSFAKDKEIVEFIRKQLEIAYRKGKIDQLNESIKDMQRIQEEDKEKN